MLIYLKSTKYTWKNSNVNVKKKDFGFRAWFYFRNGWSIYFAFIFAAINTLTVTYYLAIERVPFLVSIFPTFIHYVVITASIGIPLLILIGYAHWKRSGARKAEIDISYEVNPYITRVIVDSELILKLNLRLEKILGFIENGKLSDEQLDELKKLQNELNEFTSSRKFRSKDDWNYFKDKIR